MMKKMKGGGLMKMMKRMGGMGGMEGSAASVRADTRRCSYIRVGVTRWY